MRNSGASRAKLRDRLFAIFTAALVAALFLYGAVELGGLALTLHETVDDFITMAREISIRNMVSLVYLGPRAFDTTLEVLVVVLTVLGMNAVRGKK